MKGLLTRALLLGTLTAGVTIWDAPRASAQHQDQRQRVRHTLFGGPRCDRVIRLTLRAHRPDLRTGGTASQSPGGPFLVPRDEIGDLTIVGVTQSPPPDSEAPPTYVIAIANRSSRDVGAFRVSLVALLGRIHPHCPTAVARVASVGAGEEVSVRVTLPHGALAMGGGRGFRRVVVAIDSLDQFVESDEANNVQVLERTEIALQPPQAKPTERDEAPAPGGGPSDERSEDSLESALEEFGFEDQHAAGVSN